MSMVACRIFTQSEFLEKMSRKGSACQRGDRLGKCPATTTYRSPGAKGVLISDCLHCDIHDMLESHLQSNLAEIAAKATEVLADLILMAPPAEQLMLMADGKFRGSASGEGHITEVTSDVPVRAVMIRLA